MSGKRCLLHCNILIDGISAHTVEDNSLPVYVILRDILGDTIGSTGWYYMFESSIEHTVEHEDRLQRIDRLEDRWWTHRDW